MKIFTRKTIDYGFFIAQRFLGARTALANLQPTLNAQLSRRACAAYKSCS